MPRMIPSILFAALVVSGMVGAARAAPALHPIEDPYPHVAMR